MKNNKSSKQVLNNDVPVHTKTATNTQILEIEAKEKKKIRRINYLCIGLIVVMVAVIIAVITFYVVTTLKVNNQEENTSTNNNSNDIVIVKRYKEKEQCSFSLVNTNYYFLNI